MKQTLKVVHSDESQQHEYFLSPNAYLNRNPKTKPLNRLHLTIKEEQINLERQQI